MTDQINTSQLKNFLEIPYDKLEKMNNDVAEKAKKANKKDLEKEYKEYLIKEKGIKAVTLCFSDIEGRFHMLDYDKNFLLNSLSNLTFDGSSIHGFSELQESDLRLEVDWSSIRFIPADLFGPGKVIMFADVLNEDRTSYESDFRVKLKDYMASLKKTKGITVVAAPEIEGFLVEGVNAEQKYNEKEGFKLLSSSGYFHSLPLDDLRIFIDRAAEAQRALGFKNEKDHAEVAPAQFELSFSYCDIVRTCDQIQLYKLVCRQIANNLGMTATFLPKPISNINGNGMHFNISFAKDGKNLFYEKDGKEDLSKKAWDFIDKILNHAPELCLIFNSSVNAYRRLDPNFEAPNQIKVSSKDRSSMIRIPAGNEKSARTEIRSIAPDANPYLLAYAIVKTAFEGERLQKDKGKRDRLRYLPGTINDAIKIFKSSNLIEKIMGESSKDKYLEFKQTVANRSPRELGTIVKGSEIIYHHEVTNQMLWHKF
jgi:glutamine synthetase